MKQMNLSTKKLVQALLFSKIQWKIWAVAPVEQLSS